MKSKILFAALVAVLSIPAAQAQGVGFGVGGTPPPFRDRGGEGEGGAGGDASASSRATSTALSSSNAAANAVQGQLQGQAQVQGQLTNVGVSVGGQSTGVEVGVGGQTSTVGVDVGGQTSTVEVGVGGQSTSTTVGGQSMTYNEAAPLAFQEIRSSGRVEIENVPDVVAPSAHPTAPCRIAISGGGSGIGFGVSLGGSVLDEDCNKRELSRSFQNLGEGDAALAILCSHEGAAVAPVCKALVAAPEAAGGTIATGPRPTSGFQYDHRSGERLCAYDEILADRNKLTVCR